MKYLIFSDECGVWNEGDYYIRSWIKLTPENYILLKKEVIFSKHETGVKELKWDKFIRNIKKFKEIFSVDFSIFITITKPQHFQSTKYNIVSEISAVPASTGGEALTNKIKTKIINSAKNELFFNYFEKTHIETSKNALVGNENSQEYEYCIDAPQYLDREWKNIAKDCGIKNISIEKKSENNPGIETSDVISGCIMDFLLNNSDCSKNIYNSLIKSKMCNMRSKKYPNPNLVFY
ncbi:MAG: hypothetical protein GX941_01755, partial [Candidatus Methanofastidiosa archaeon]|nr:hypothetical protein [Candidatus Methanofastidiosa archaeon]